MVIKKNTPKKILSIVLAILMVMTTIPMAVLFAFAANDDFVVANVNNKNLYLYGVTSSGPVTEDGDYYAVEYTGGDETASGFYVDGNEFTVSTLTPEVKYETHKILLLKSWFDSQTKWMAVKCLSTSVIPSAEPETPLPTIDDVTISGYDDKYDGDEHGAVIVEGTKKGDVVSYSVDGGEFSSTLPKVKYPGDEKKVVVKIERDGYQAFVSSEYTAKVSNGKIKDVIVTPFNGTYNRKDTTEKPAVTVSGTDGTYNVQYSTDGGQTYKTDVPTIALPGSLEITVKVSRQYYDDYITTVTAVMNNATIDGIEVTVNSNVIYDGASHPVVLPDGVAGTVDGDEVLYSTDGTEYSKNIPEYTDAGDYTFYVKVKRAYHNDYVTFPALTFTIGKASIEGVTATGYIGDFSLSTLLSGVDFVTLSFPDGFSKDDFVISYYKNGVKSSEPYKVYTAKDNSGKNKYKVELTHKSGNYETITFDNIDVGINRIPQTMAFVKDIPDSITYKEENTFTYAIDEKSLVPESDGKITYSIDDVAKKNGFSVDKTTGKVTYTKVGKVVVTATRAQDDKYLSTSSSYTIEIKYAEAPQYNVSTPNYTDNGGTAWYSYEKDSDKFVVTPAEGWEIIKGSNSLGQNTWTSSLTEENEGVYKEYTVAFRNKETKEITKLIDIGNYAIDKTNPHDIYFKFNPVNDGKLKKFINKLSFGLFFNERIDVTVTASDESIVSSGIKSIQLFKYNYNENGSIISIDEVLLDPKSQDVSTGTAKFSIDPKFVGVLKAEVIDNVGRSSGRRLSDDADNRVMATTINSNIGDDKNTGYIMLENTAPVDFEISSEAAATDVRSANVGNKTIYSGNIRFSFTVQDKESGLNNVVVTMNGKACINMEDVDGNLVQSTDGKILFADTNDRTTQDIAPHKFFVNTANESIEANDDGSYNVSVTVTDNAGNAIERHITVYKDTTSATIDGFNFDLSENIDVDKNSEGIYDAVESTDYGFYFKNKVTVTISASDIKSDKQIVSGVKSITYKAVDINGNIEYLGEEPVDSKNQISFEIDKDFKGQIYAYATDNVGNSPLNSALPASDRYDSSAVVSSGDYKGFVHPNSAILETPEKHEDSSINFTVPKAQGTQNNTLSSWTYGGKANQKDKKMDYNVSAQVPLYNSTQTFVVNVTDEYSGIREIKYSLIEGEKTTSHTLTVDNAKSINGLNSGDIATGNDTANSSEKWNVVSEATATESNLVTAIKSTVTVDGNYNDMVLLVELVDRVGNSSYDYIAFGIDQTPTTISVSYDNNNADTKSGSSAFFNANRTATITVKERNFNTENIEWTIRNAEGTAPTHSAPKFTQGSGNRDDDTYVYTVTYSNDGIYSFDMKYTDRAGNKNQSIDYGNSVAPTKFVVDKTMPVISVSYDNNDARNEKYFNAYRTATVTVTEHNFDVSRVTITGTASLDGNAVKFPDASWSNSGDTHVATIKYDTDADYTFDISMDDMAGNKSNEANYGSSVAPKDFVVDTTIDKPVIGGVENGNSYKDSVLPKIDFSDINFKDVKVTLLRTRKDEIDKDVTSDYINVSTNDKGGSFAATEDTFKKIQENDGIYTLSVQITDKAENTSSDEVTFTVNRFGSVYSLGTYLSNDLNDKYVQSIDNDIVITEYNPDRLVEGNLDVVVTRDGSPVEYGDGELTISPVVNELAKIGSSGWYQYEYTISKNVFTDDNGNPIDGIYKVYVGSEDTVGNKSENISYDESSVLFRLDHTAPTIKSVSGLDKKIVNANEQKVSYEVFDAIGIDSIDVYYYDGNGTRVDHIRSTDKGSTDVTDILSDLTNYTGSFTIGSSTTSEPVRIVIKDLAGNVTDTDSKDFDVDSIDFNRAITVSTNFFVRWFANKIVFGCSIAAIIAVGGGLAFFIAIRKRRKDEAITEEIKKKARGTKD